MAVTAATRHRGLLLLLLLIGLLAPVAAAAAAAAAQEPHVPEPSTGCSTLPIPPRKVRFWCANPGVYCMLIIARSADTSLDRNVVMRLTHGLSVARTHTLLGALAREGSMGSISAPAHLRGTALPLLGTASLTYLATSRGTSMRSMLWVSLRGA
eukprot:COSAG01_NODE_25252_length_751_cov_0.711656_2_plen_154_part_00